VKRLLILGAPVFQIEVIQKARQIGCHVGVVDINPDAPAFPYADEFFIASITDAEKILEIAKTFRPDGIIAGACDTAVLTVSKICGKLNLAGISSETALNATDKVRMLGAFARAGVAHPRYFVVRKDELDDAKIEMHYPLISKPVDSAGGRGVKIVHKEDELREAMRYSSAAGKSGDVLLEEYMKGPEVSVEVVVADGIPYVAQVTDKITSGEPNFFEVGHSQPSALKEETKEEIKALAKASVLAVGINNSPAHVEIIVTENGPKMVELGARLGSDCITSYLTDTSVSGISMMESAIKLALGEKPEIGTIRDSGTASAVRFIPAREGTICSIGGLDAAQQCPGVVHAVVMGRVGRHYERATDDSARFGYVVCKGKTTGEALMMCDAAMEKIHIAVV